MRIPYSFITAFALALACGSNSGTRPRTSSELPSCGPFAARDVPVTRPVRQVVQSRHGGAVTQLKFSPTGLLATASTDGTRLWNVRHRGAVSVIRDVASAIPFAWDLEGKRLVSGRLIYDIDGGVAGRLDQVEFFFAAAAAKGPHAWVGMSHAGVNTYDDALKPARVRPALGMNAHLGWLDKHPSFALSPQRTTAAWAPRGTGYVVEDLTRGVSVDVDVGGHATIVGFFGSEIIVAIAPTAERSHFEPRQVMAIDAVDSKRRRTIMTLPAAERIVLSRRGKLASATGTRIDVWDLATGALLWSRVAPTRAAPGGEKRNGKFTELDFSPTDPMIAIGTNDGSVYVYDEASGRLQAELGDDVRTPTELAFGNDHLVVRSNDQLTTWSLKDAAVLYQRTVPGLETFAVSGTHVVALRRDEWAAACASGSSGYHFDGWPIESPPDVFPRSTKSNVLSTAPTSPPHTVSASVLCRELSPGLVTGAPSPAAKPYRVSNEPAPEQPNVQTVGDTVDIYRDIGVLWKSDGTRLGTFRIDLPPDQRTVRGKPQTRLAHGVGQMVLAGDSTHLAVTFASTLQIRALPGLEVTASVSLPAPAEYVAIVPVGNGNGFAALSSDGRMQVVRDGKLAAEGHADGDRPQLTGSTATLYVDPSGKRAAAIYRSGLVRIWNLETGAMMATLVAFADDEWIATAPDGSYHGSGDVGTRVTWTFQQPLELFGFERFAAFRSQARMAAHLRGDALPKGAGVTRPPRVEIVSVKHDANGDAARVTIAASSQSRVDAIRLYAEGRQVAAAGVCGDQGRVTLDVPLVAGVNRVSAVAFDADGQASNPAVVDITGPRVSTTRPEIWILAVGISEYPRLSAESQLTAADDDARSIAAAFQRLAGPGRPFATAHVDLLIDGAASVGAITAAADRLAKMRPTDVAVVFFAGHGVKHGARGDMVFLTGASDTTDAGIAAGSVGWDALGSRLAAARGRVLVLLDACHSGHVTQDLLVPSSALAAGLTTGGRAGMVIFSAAKGRQPSWEPGTTRALKRVAAMPIPVGETADHGLFTGAVLLALAEADADRNSDGALQLSELIDEVTVRVVRATAGAQTPWIARRELFGDFVIAPSGTAHAAPPPPTDD